MDEVGVRVDCGVQRLASVSYEVGQLSRVAEDPVADDVRLNVLRVLVQLWMLVHI
jgi:hypothetical protein